MINRKIAFSAMSIVASLGLMGGATFAFFSDQASATNNTFATGSADLQIGVDTGSENTVVFANSFDAPDFNNLYPGFTSETTFWLKNNSSSPISLNVAADLANLVEAPGADLKNNLMIKWACDTDDNASLGDNTPTAEFSVNDWVTGGNAVLGTIAQGNAIICRMYARVPTTADNTIAGESLSFDVLYDATQQP